MHQTASNACNKICRIAKTSVSPGQLISVLPKSEGDAPRQLKRDLAKDPDILYEDKQILVVNKPVGLLSVSTDLGNEKDTMHSRVFEWVKGKEKGRIFIVHRLDRETSGCMLFLILPMLQLGLGQELILLTQKIFGHGWTT